MKNRSYLWYSFSGLFMWIVAYQILIFLQELFFWIFYKLLGLEFFAEIFYFFLENSNPFIAFLSLIYIFQFKKKFHSKNRWYRYSLFFTILFFYIFTFIVGNVFF